jgi:hypothetical protein
MACGWVIFVTGAVLVSMMGLAWLGGADAFKMISSLAMGCLFMSLGRTFIARGKALPGYNPAGGSEAGRQDQSAARRLVIQAIWIGGVIILAVAFAVGFLMFLFGQGGKP